MFRKFYLEPHFETTPECPIGLLIANLVADFTESAQPALLYLVPCALIPLLGKAMLQVSSLEDWLLTRLHTVQFVYVPSSYSTDVIAIQGDFRAMWSGPFTKGEKGYQKISQYSLLPTWSRFIAYMNYHFILRAETAYNFKVHCSTFGTIFSDSIYTCIL